MIRPSSTVTIIEQSAPQFRQKLSIFSAIPPPQHGAHNQSRRCISGERGEAEQGESAYIATPESVRDDGGSTLTMGALADSVIDGAMNGHRLSLSGARPYNPTVSSLARW